MIHGHSDTVESVRAPDTVLSVIAAKFSNLKRKKPDSKDPTPARGVFGVGIRKKTVARKQQERPEETRGLSPVSQLLLECLHLVLASHQQVLFTGAAGSLDTYD